MNGMNGSNTNTILIVMVLLLLVGGGVWWYTAYGPGAPKETGTGIQLNVGGGDGSASNN